MSLTKVSYSMINGAPINVLDYGAYNDGTNATATTTAIRAAIAAAQLHQANVYFPTGVYSINDTINLADTPIGLVGEQNPVWQSGSTLPSVTIQWTGGAAPMFNCTYSNFQFEGMAISNLTNATDFLYISNGQRYRFYRMSWIWGSGTNPFSRSVIYCADPSFGYSTVSSCQFSAQAPYFLYIIGTGSANGLTPFVFDDRCIFESAASYPVTVIYFKDVNADTLTIENCTFNQQGGELRILATIDTPRSPTTIASLNFNNNEWDYSIGTSVLDRMMQLTNVNNIMMNGNNFQCGGSTTAVIELVNSNVAQFAGNFVRAASIFFNADANSFVTIGYNNTEYASMDELVSSTAKGWIPITWASPNTFFPLNDGDASRNTVYVINVTGSGAWQIGFRTGGGTGWTVPGQVFTVMVKNTSGGAISTPSFSSSIHTAGAFTVPANGYNRSITFMYNGTNFIELYRTAADVAN